MSKLMFLILVHISLSNCRLDSMDSVFRTRVNSDVQKKAAEGVISRLLGPVNSKLFNLVINEDDEDGFHLLKNDNEKRVLVVGPNGVSLVWGVHYYLKNYCNCHISWDGDQLYLPPELPSVNVSIKSIDSIRYYQNACTSSYSFVWWDWERWEREIDWMALNGINLALAFTAQEAIWQRVYDALGLSSNDFTGPAFLAWNRMGNLRNFSHGLTYNWHQQQLSLQHKILNRMKALGIIPVLPAFCGIVPRSFLEAYPLSNVTEMSQWSRFSKEYCCPYFLSPSDSLFSIISRVFLREYSSEFGTSHIYSCDTFNENTPSSGNSEYLSGISKGIYTGISQVDSDAIWMIQGWMFISPFWSNNKRVKAFLSGVPIGKMLILDLQSDLTPQYQRLESYYGHSFVWCMLLNFGGQLGMYGHLERINLEVLKGRSFPNSTMVGVGITPEGIDQNYLMYDFALESSLRSESVNLSEWVSRYANRRYGVFNEDVNEAWLILKDTAYNYRPESLRRVGVSGSKSGPLLYGEHISKNILTRLPSMRMNEPSWYNRSRMFDVFQKFLSAVEDVKLRSSELFHHDLIDVTRQTVQLAVGNLYFKLLTDYAQVDVDSFQLTSAMFLDIIEALDEVLKSGRKFLLGKWLEDAKRCARNLDESIHYEYNARNQITLWGPNGEIRDYAAKQWSGLVSDYYRPRWVVFIEALNHSLVNNVSFNGTAVKEKIFQSVERPFGERRDVYPSEPTGDPVDVVRKFADVWEDSLRDIFQNMNFEMFQVKSL